MLMFTMLVLGLLGCGDGDSANDDGGSCSNTIMCNDGTCSPSCTSCSQGCCSSHDGC
jgi:hypothetical protein